MSKKAKSALRAVADDETAPAPSPKTIAEAVERDERTLLVALREKVAAEIDAGVPPAYLAPVMRQLREIDKAIRSLDAVGGEDSIRGGQVDDQSFDASAI